MIFLLFVYLLPGRSQAAPLSSISTYTLEHLVEETTACSFLTNSSTRSIWSIIWSCLTTIFACTWISVHPNIPALEDKYWRIMRRRMKLMFWTIIAPESVIYWAARQWIGARRIERECRLQYGWTKTHGFFVQMGGFMLYNGEHPVHPLSFDELLSLYGEHKINWPKISEAEIFDRSKGDFLSKGIVILQTTWFIAQCIARGIGGLVITELELVTLAFAFLNGAMYFFWWNKPLDVQIPIPVLLLSSESDGEKTRGGDNGSSPGDPRDKSNDTSSNIDPVLVESLQNRTISVENMNSSKDILAILPEVLNSSPGREQGMPTGASTFDMKELEWKGKEEEIIAVELQTEKVQEHNDGNGLRMTEKSNKCPSAPDSIARVLLSTILQSIKNVLASITRVPVTFIRKIRQEIAEKGTYRAMWLIFIYRPFRAVIRPVSDMVESGRSSDIDPDAKRVHTFYATKKLKEYNAMDFIVVSVAVVFGGIHCVAWSFEFPSEAEKNIWRCASLVTVGIPAAFIGLGIYVLMFPFIHVTMNDPEFDMPQMLALPWPRRLLILVFLLSSISMALILPLYILARLSLLLQALIAMRGLAPGAYATVDWTTFIPHL